jgi:hypothetical protein
MKRSLAVYFQEWVVPAGQALGRNDFKTVLVVLQPGSGSKVPS